MARFVMDYQWRVEWNPTSVIEQLNYRAGIGTYENIRANAFPGTPFGEDYFQNPHLYFYADGDFLRCLRVGVSIRMIPNITASAESIQKLIAAYPGISDQNVWTILSPIYNYLRQLRYTPYYKALVEFKWRAGLLQFPLFDQFGMVAVSDGRLVGGVAEGNQYQWRLLTDKLVNAEIQRWGGKEISDSDLKRRLARNLLELHKEPERKSRFEASFSWANVHYVPVEGRLHVRFNQPIQPGMMLPQKPVLSHEGKACLRSLVEDDITRLDTIAELIARIHMKERPSEYLWVISGAQNEIAQFVRLLWELTERAPFGSGAYESESKRDLRIAEELALGMSLQINSGRLGANEFKSVSFSFLKKFVTGDVVAKLDDPYVLNSEVRGKSVLICAAEQVNEEPLKRVPYRMVRIPVGWTWSAQQNDYVWMLTVLLCHGVRLLNDVETKAKEPLVPLDDAIRMFIKNFCTTVSTSENAGEKPSYTDRGEFCRYLMEYCETCLKTEPIVLGPTKLGQYIKDIMCWECKEIRQNNNRLGFVGVCMDTRKIDDAIREAREKNADLSAGESIDNYIDGLANHVVQSAPTISVTL